MFWFSTLYTKGFKFKTFFVICSTFTSHRSYKPFQNKSKPGNALALLPKVFLNTMSL